MRIYRRRCFSSSSGFVSGKNQIKTAINFHRDQIAGDVQIASCSFVFVERAIVFICCCCFFSSLLLLNDFVLASRHSTHCIQVRSIHQFKSPDERIEIATFKVNILSITALIKLYLFSYFVQESRVKSQESCVCRHTCLLWIMSVHQRKPQWRTQSSREDWWLWTLAANWASPLAVQILTLILEILKKNLLPSIIFSLLVTPSPLVYEWCLTR